MEDEFQILKNTVPRKIRFLIGKYVWFTVGLPSNYPSTESPMYELEVKGGGISSVHSKELKQFVTAALNALSFRPGSACLFEWAQFLMSEVPLPTPETENKHDSPKSKVDCQPTKTTVENEAVVVFIDHMNDSTGYLKKLKRWGSNFSLKLSIWYTLPSGLKKKN